MFDVPFSAAPPTQAAIWNVKFKKPFLLTDFCMDKFGFSPARE